MYELTYSSKAKSDLSEDDINSILLKAREFNTKNNITGCLLYYNREFIQLLEGDKEIITGLFEAISKDPRHTNTVLLAEGEKENRVFDDWSMAYHELDMSNAKDMDTQLFAGNFITFSELAKKTTFPTIMFWNLAKQMLAK